MSAGGKRNGLQGRYCFPPASDLLALHALVFPLFFPFGPLPRSLRVSTPCVTRVTTKLSKGIKVSTMKRKTWPLCKRYSARFTSHKSRGSLCHSSAFPPRCRKRTMTIEERLAQCPPQTFLQKCNADCVCTVLSGPLGPQLYRPSLIFGCSYLLELSDSGDKWKLRTDPSSNACPDFAGKSRFFVSLRIGRAETGS